MYSARVMLLVSLGLLNKIDYNYFRKIDEPEIYFGLLGKRPLEFWKEEFKDLGLVMETELIHVINLVKRNEQNEVLIGIRLEDY